MRYSPRSIRIACDHAGLTHYGDVFFAMDFGECCGASGFLTRRSEIPGIDSTASPVFTAIRNVLLLGHLAPQHPAHPTDK